MILDLVHLKLTESKKSSVVNYVAWLVYHFLCVIKNKRQANSGSIFIYFNHPPALRISLWAFTRPCRFSLTEAGVGMTNRVVDHVSTAMAGGRGRRGHAHVHTHH